MLIIFTTIENEMDHVADEGFTFQLLVEDCFEVLKIFASALSFLAILLTGLLLNVVESFRIQR